MLRSFSNAPQLQLLKCHLHMCGRNVRSKVGKELYQPCSSILSEKKPHHVSPLLQKRSNSWCFLCNVLAFFSRLQNQKTSYVAFKRNISNKSPGLTKDQNSSLYLEGFAGRSSKVILRHSVYPMAMMKFKAINCTALNLEQSDTIVFEQ